MFARAPMLPRLAVLFLHTANQPRFAFKKAGERSFKGVRTWEVRFEETARPTIIGLTNGDLAAPASGAFWIDPATGRVLQSLLKHGDKPTVYDEITVTYGLDAGTGIWLPLQLKDRTAIEDVEEFVEGVATFTKWRAASRAAGH
jgi:hypothetical protein